MYLESSLAFFLLVSRLSSFFHQRPILHATLQKSTKQPQQKRQAKVARLFPFCYFNYEKDDKKFSARTASLNVTKWPNLRMFRRKDSWSGWEIFSTPPIFPNSPTQRQLFLLASLSMDLMFLDKKVGYPSLLFSFNLHLPFSISRSFFPSLYDHFSFSDIYLPVSITLSSLFPFLPASLLLCFLFLFAHNHLFYFLYSN